MGLSSANVAAWFRQERAVIAFLLRFAALVVVFYAVLLLPMVDQAVLRYLEINAAAAGWILNGFGFGVEVSGITIRSPDFAISVRRGCDAIEPAFLFAAAVVAYPAPVAAKLSGIIFGVLVILAMNVARIISLFWLGVQARAFFATAHLEVWPVLFLLAAIICWFVWMKRTQASHAD